LCDETLDGEIEQNVPASRHKPEGPIALFQTSCFKYPVHLAIYLFVSDGLWCQNRFCCIAKKEFLLGCHGVSGGQSMPLTIS
jgi:hypothetical protein